MTSQAALATTAAYIIECDRYYHYQVEWLDLPEFVVEGRMTPIPQPEDEFVLFRGKVTPTSINLETNPHYLSGDWNTQAIIDRFSLKMTLIE